MMTITRATAVAALFMLAACAKSDERPEFKFNPSPKQAHEVTLTIGADAPGPFAGIHGQASYHAPDCWYVVNRAMGVPGHPEEGVPVEFVKVGERTYQGTFYLDAMLDEEDYDGPDGSASCHWKLIGVSAYLYASGAPGETQFNPDLLVADVLAEKAVTTYINKRNYPRNSEIDTYRAFGRTKRSEFGPSITDDDLFTVTLTAKKVAP